jgi:mono/diheme cytochrome c family protein
MNLKITSGAVAIALMGFCATQSFAQAGADVVAAQPAQRGGAAPMPKPVTESSRPDATGGEKAYLEKCAMCHAPPGMGVGLLARRTDQPNLELRDNLTAEYVIAYARNGIGNMPAITRAEVSDKQLKAIADYLAAGPHPKEVAK